MLRIRSDIPTPSLLKRFTLIYLPIAIALSIVLFASIRFDTQLRIETAEVSESGRIEVARERIAHDLSTIEIDLRVIANLPAMRSYLDRADAAHKNELEKILLDLARETRRYDQIRYLDASGREIIRINFNHGNPVVVPAARLQNKSDRYYFRDTIGLKPGEVFVSPLDLNVEHGSLEVPHKPMIRYGTPLFDSTGRKKGAILLNYFGNDLLLDFRAAMNGGNPHRSMLLNRNGYWLQSDNPEDEWGFMLGKEERTFGHDSPIAWRTILATGHGSLLTGQGLYVFTTIHPLLGEQHSSTGSSLAHAPSRHQIKAHEYFWKIVSFVPHAALAGDAFYNQPMGRILIVAVYLLLALASYFVALVMLNRKRAQMALRDSATRIQTILDNVADGIITINTRGIVETYNAAAERIFGYAADEIVGQNVSMLMPEPYLGEHDGYIEHYLATGKAHVIGTVREAEGQRKDGDLFPIELGISEMMLEDQRHFTGIVRDITARKEAENQLNLFFALSLDMLCISSADGYFKRVNPAFTKTLGWSTEEMLTRPYIDFVHPDDHAATLREVERQVDAGESVLHFENRYRHKDGSWRTLSWVSVPYSGGLMFATARDVTESKQTEQALIAAKEQAEKANHAKDSFLATMSHEIRTPLTGMLGMLEMLSLTTLDGEQNRTLQAAWDSGRGLLRIVSDILDWSKIEAGKLELCFHSTSIPQLLQEVVNTYSRVASGKGLMLSQHADTSLSLAYIVDPLRLSQVLNNFVSNAIKFTQRGEVELRAELLERLNSRDRIRFSVKDTGIGIPRDVQSRLFRRYQQEGPDTARMYGGTGLGLSICQRLAELMDGQIELESEPDQGSVFSITLTLPVSETPWEAVQTQTLTEAQRKVTPLIEPGSTDAPRVLAVDDHPINRDLLARQIELLGLQAETAENGQMALSMWQGGRFGLLITDCHMPEMDGYALAREIRKVEAEEQRPRTPIIAWTANALAEEAEFCLAAGMDEILVKPTNLKQLRKVLASTLSMTDTEIGQPASASVHDTASHQSTGPIDFAELEKVVPDRAEHMQVLHDFRSHIRDDHAKLLTLLKQGEPPAIEQVAHRMKGSSLTVGAIDLASACAAVEQAARDADMSAMKATGKALDEALTRFEAFLAEAGKSEGERE